MSRKRDDQGSFAGDSAGRPAGAGDGRRRLTRRELLRLVAAAGGTLAVGDLLLACAPSTPSTAPAKAPAATSAPPAQIPTPAQAAPAAATAVPKPAATAAAAPKKGGVIKVALLDDASTTDPYIPSTNPPWDDIRRQIADKLITWGDKFEFIPDLADSWSISPDGKTYTFKLRKGVKFQNGEELTGDDVKWSLERIKAIAQRKGDYASIQTIDVPDPYTVVLNLSKVDAALLSALSIHYAHIVNKKAGEADLKANNNVMTKPIGTGPFRLDSWTPNRQLVLKRFDGFTSRTEPTNGIGGQRTPWVDEIDFLAMPDANSRLLALEAGQIDYVQQVEPKDVERLKKNANLEVAIGPGTDWGCLYFNLQHPLFKNLKMRQAVAAALNYDELVKAIFWGYGTVNNSLIPPVQAIWRTSEHDRLHKTDLALASSLAKEAGYAGEELVWLTRSDYRSDKASQVIQAQLKKAGINMRIQVMEPAAFLDEFYARRSNRTPTWPMCALTSSAYRPDPGQHYQIRGHSSQNPGMYNNPAYDEIVTKAGSITDFEQRKALYSQAQKIVMDEIPFIVLYDAPFIDAYNKRLQGIVVRDIISPFFWNTWIK